MKHWKMKGFLLLLSLMLVIAGCGGNTESGSSTTEPAETPAAEADAGSDAGAAASDKVLTIANAIDLESFDFHNNNQTVSESILVNMFDYLLKNDDKGNQVPGLATSWEKLDDTTWRFKLREGVTFHNGDPFTSADVKFTLERAAKDTTLKQNTLYKQILEVKIVDEYTVDIVTDGPDPTLLNRLSRMGSGMMPSKYIEANGMEAFLQAPIGTGPYKFVQWTKDDRVEMVANPDYFGGAPKWDKLVFRAIPEASTRVAELLTGGVDIAAGVPSTDVERIDASGDAKVVKAPIKRVLQILLRHTEGTPTADPKVREAIDLAIDKQAIVDSIAGGAGVLTRTSVTPGNFGTEPSLYGQALYDPERAKQLLQEAGYTSAGPVVSFSAQSQYKEYAEVVAAMLTAVGFTVNLEVLEASAFSEKMSSKSFGEIFMLGIGNSMNDASNNYTRYLFERAKGESDYNNPEVEELLQAAAVNMDPASRLAQFQQVQNIFAEDRPAVYLFQMEGMYGVGAGVEFAPRSDEMFFAEEINPVE